MLRAAALTVIPMVAWAAASSQPVAANGRIYVYELRPSAGRSWRPILCGGVEAAELKEGMFFAINVPAGRHTVRTESGVPASVDVHSGEEVFVRLDWSYQAGRAPIAELHVVPPERARKEMRYLSYIGAKKVHSPSVPAADPRERTPARLKTRPAQ